MKTNKIERTANQAKADNAAWANAWDRNGKPTARETNRCEIRDKIADANVEIIEMLQRIQRTLTDPNGATNNWSDVAEANRLRDDLRAILEYRK